MLFKNGLFLIILFAICLSCSQKQEKVADLVKKADQAAETGFIVNGQGDTFPSGVPIPVQGRRIHPDSVLQPKTKPLINEPKKISVNKSYPAGTPKKVKIPDTLRVITPGKDGIPLPKRVPSQGKTVPALFTPPIPSLPFLKNDTIKNNIQYIKGDQGILSNGINAILEDKRGHLWFASSGIGVSRFDGHSFTHFTEKEGLSGNRVWSILEDSQGRLWFGTNDGGVSRFDGHSFTHFTEKEGLSGNRVLSILEDSQRHLWFSTSEGGISRFDGHSFAHFTSDNGLSSNYIYDILEDGQGRLWFGTFRRGVSRLDPFEGESGTFTHYTIKEGLCSNDIFSMLEDSEGNLWLGTQFEGLNRFKVNSFTYFTIREGLSHNNVFSAYEDNKGTLWFGTENGLSRFDGHSFTNFTEGFGSIGSILEDKKGYFWLGTIDGLRRFDPKANEGKGSLTHFTTKEGLSGNFIYSIIEDHQGNLWFGTEGGVSRFDGHGFMNFTEKEGLSGNRVLSILEDSQGRLWFGTNGGVTQYSPSKGKEGGTFIHFISENGLSSDVISSMLEDSKGNLWFGTSRGEINRFDGHNFSQLKIKSRFSTNVINFISEDHEQNIWIGTGRTGLTILAPPFNDASLDDYQIFHFDKRDGLSDLLLHSFVLDNQNRIWMGSLNGVNVLDLNHFSLSSPPPKIWLDYIKVNEKEIDFRLLRDTAYANQFTFGNVLRHSFDSVAAFFNYPVNLTLPHTLKQLSFHFSAIDWKAPHKIRYQFMIEGLDKKWSEPSSESKADYRNIPPGNHLFKVRAMGAGQVWSEPFEYTFTIRPPWYWNIWSIVIYLLGIVFLIYWMYWYQLNRKLAFQEARRLRELDTVKTQLYTNITHEFRTPLTIITGMADQIGSNPQKWLRDGLSMIKRNSKILLDLVNQMLDLRQLESGSMKLNMVQGDVIPYLKYLLESFHSFAKAKGIRIHFISNIPACRMDYDAEKLQQIVTNLMSNAIKFTPDGGDVYMIVDQMGSDQFSPYRGPGGGPAKKEAGIRPSTFDLQIKVRDTGIGISQENLSNVFDRFYQVDASTTRPGEGTGIGLSLTKALVELLGGTISVTSELDKGSEFQVMLPISRHAEELERPHHFEPLETFVLAAPSFNKRAGKGMMIADLPLALVVEDNTEVVQYLLACLDKEYQIEVAKDGQEGIEKALALIPDIIVSDVMMPKKNGFELCETLKKDERTSHIPIVLLTAKADPTSKKEGLQHGADAYLTKPFDKEELFIRLHKLIELRNKLRTHFQSGKKVIRSPQENEYPIEKAFLNKLIMAVERRIDDPQFGPNEVAEVMKISRSQLHRKLKAITGHSTSIFIRAIRLKKASELLADPKKNISEVVYESGFSSPAYFNQVFKDEFGKTPSEWRKGV